MKIYMETLGCPKNFNDSEVVAGILERTGHEVFFAGEDQEKVIRAADAVIVNTCGFINDAKKESIDVILEMAKVCRGKKRKLLIVTGCLSQRYGEELFEEIPEADLILGVNDYEKLPELLDEYSAETSADPKRQKHLNPYEKEFEPGCRKLFGEKSSRTLKIAEGCNNRCSYCVIPQIRGPYRSRPKEEILKEAETLAKDGCKELILIAQDVTAWGTLQRSPDIKAANRGKLAEAPAADKKEGSGGDLPELLRELAKIRGIKWIRLMYCYPERISDELIEVMASEEKICNYIDMPLQHVNSRILNAMNRHSNKKDIREIVGKLRAAMPDIHIRTTFITGFPGETEEEYKELMDFAEEMKFERMGAFAYSREEGTKAAEMPDQIPEEIREERRYALMRRQADISLAVNMKKIGKIIETLIEEEDEENLLPAEMSGDGAETRQGEGSKDGAEKAHVYIGRSPYDAPEIDDSVIVKTDKKHMPGDMIRVKITDAFDYDLTGEEV